MNKLSSAHKIILWTIGLATVEVAAFFVTQRFSHWVGDTSIPPNTPAGASFMPIPFLISLVLVAIFSVYIGRQARQGTPIPFKLVGAIAIITAIIVIARPPIGSADNYWNTLMMRGWVEQGADPYLSSPNDFPSDPLFPQTALAWRSWSVVYGPLWTLISAVPIALSKNIPVQLALMKGVHAVAYLLAGAMLYRHFSKKKKPGVAESFFVFWLFSPVALFEIANAGHNEGLLILALAAVVLALESKKYPQAALAILVAALIKLWPAILLPTLLASKEKNTTWLKFVAIVVGVTAISMLPFPGIFTMMQTTLDHAVASAGNANVFFYSPLRFIILSLGLIMTSNADLAEMLARNTSLAIFVLVVAVISYRAWKKTYTPTMAGALLVIALLAIPMAWVQSWYLLALTPFAFALDDGPTPRGLAYLALIGFLSYVINLGSIALIVAIAMLPPMRKNLQGIADLFREKPLR